MTKKSHDCLYTLTYAKSLPARDCQTQNSFTPSSLFLILFVLTIVLFFILLVFAFVLLVFLLVFLFFLLVFFLLCVLVSGLIVNEVVQDHRGPKHAAKVQCEHRIIC